jgi:hypothetical protein
MFTSGSSEPWYPRQMLTIFRAKGFLQNRLIIATKYLLSDYSVVPLNILLSFRRV